MYQFNSSNANQLRLSVRTMLNPKVCGKNIYQLSGPSAKNVAKLCDKLVIKGDGQAKLKYSSKGINSDDSVYVMFGGDEEKKRKKKEKVKKSTKIHRGTNKKSNIGFDLRFNFNHKRDNKI